MSLKIRLEQWLGKHFPPRYPKRIRLPSTRGFNPTGDDRIWIFIALAVILFSFAAALGLGKFLYLHYLPWIMVVGYFLGATLMLLVGRWLYYKSYFKYWYQRIRKLLKF